MGGSKQKANTSDRRMVNNDRLLWPAIISLAEERVDEFPFTAMDVCRRIGKHYSGAMITRERGGLKQFLCDNRNSFMNQLEDLVKAERNNTGAIDILFCRKLGFLMTDYHYLFELDVVTYSHRNMSFMINVLKSLIYDSHLLMFKAELHQLLSEWVREELSRGSVLGKYEKRLHSLFTKHQINRPDMSVSVIKSRSINQGSTS